MSRGRRSKRLEGLQKAAELRQHVRLDRRSRALDKQESALVGMSAKLLLIQPLDDHLRLNGYTAIPIADVKTYTVYQRAEPIVARAAEFYKEEPQPLPGLDLSDVGSLWRTAGALYPLLTVHRERRDNATCYIGRFASVGKRILWLHLIDRGGVWDKEPERFRLKEITRVDFGGGYENVLWKMYKETALGLS